MDNLNDDQINNNDNQKNKALKVVFIVLGGIVLLFIIGGVIFSFFVNKMINSGIEGMTNGKIKVDNNGDTSSITFKDEKGEDNTITSKIKDNSNGESLSLSDIPEGFPIKEIPLYEVQTIKSVNRINLGGSDNYNIEFISKLSLKEMFNYYNDILNKNDFKVSYSGIEDGDYRIISNRGEGDNMDYVNLLISKENDSNITIITYMTKAK